MKGSGKKGLLFMVALILGLSFSMTVSAATINGEEQWSFRSTIDFGNTEVYFNAVLFDANAISESTLQIKDSWRVEYVDWYSSQYHRISLSSGSQTKYLCFQPVDYQSESPKTPAGICLVSGDGTQASPYKFGLWYSNTVTEEEIERVSTVYAGEIFVDGESKMTWLYSTDLSNSEIVFQRLRECLSQTAFDGLVPAMTGETAAKGLAVSSDHQSEMGSGWKSAATVAGQYFTGTVGSEKSGNFYDENAVYKTAVDAHYAERKETYDTPLGFNKTIGSALSTTTDFVWENHGDALKKKYTVTAKVEETTVIYTTVNVTTEPQSANVKTAPTANTLTYTGSAQELVTAGEATGGTMHYALGTNAATVPTTGWSTSVPTKTDAGTYYVWYRAKGDEGYLDSTPVCVSVTINEQNKAMVTFKVVNGSWDDGKTEDRTVTLSGEKGDTLKLLDDQIPAVGAKPNDGYMNGAWDKTPSTETAITADTVYTYTYAENDKPKPEPTPTDAGISLNQSEAYLTIGTEKALKAKVTPDGTPVTWTSSDKSVAFVNNNGIVTGLKLGTATITATITVDGKDYSASCKVTVVPASYIPSGKSDGGHQHEFIWETIEATEEDDGELRYQCKICGEIQNRVPLTAYNVFNKNATEKIRKAPKDAAVKIETNKWISFHKMVMEALAERPDVTLEISFLDQGYKGNRCTVTIPKGTDAMSLVDKNGFTGFLYLGGKFGLKTN